MPDTLIFSSARSLPTNPFVLLLILSPSCWLVADAYPCPQKAYKLVVLSSGLSSGGEDLGCWSLTFCRSWERKGMGESTKWEVYKCHSFSPWGYQVWSELSPGTSDCLAHSSSSNPLMVRSNLRWNNIRRCCWGLWDAFTWIQSVQ